MEAESARLQAGLAQAESRIDDLSREVQTLKGMFEGKSPQTIKSPSGVNGFNNTFEVIAQPLGAEEAAESGVFNHPFKLTVATDANGTHTWRVVYQGSTITDGTNGDSIDLVNAGFDADNNFTGTKYIVLEADVTADLAITNWALAAAASTTDAEEVKFNTATPPTQEKIRLFIGKVAIEGTAPNQGPVAYQACYTAQMIVHGFLNGSLVKVFSASPGHPADV